MTNTPTPPIEQTIDALMEQAQAFASTWSLVGGMFDNGQMLGDAEAEKAALRIMIAAALASPQAEPVTQQGQGERPAGTGGVPVELDRCDSLILADGYRGGSCIADGDSNTVMLHYRTSEQAEAAFDVITTAIDAGNAGVSASDGQTKPLSAADTSTNKESHSGTTRKSLD